MQKFAEKLSTLATTYGRTIRKFIGGGGGGNLRAARIFFVTISPAGILFFPVMCKNIFSGLLAVHNFFSLNFPGRNFFVLPSPPKTNFFFLMARPLQTKI